MIPYMNHGRWVIDCPSINCTAGLKVPPAESRMVCDCQDQEICQHDPICQTVIPIEWPEDFAAIETVMAARSIINRNWLPGESIEDLVEENTAHGLDRS